MTTGWVLIFAVLFLGGVIATVGDRLGMRVGKARLSLFNLRPRQTATLITILTGGLISASTLAVLLAVSDQLRTGLFELQNIQDDLETTQLDLEEATAEKEQVEDQLQEARQQRRDAQQQRRNAQQQLEQINRDLQTSQEQQRRTQAQLQQTQSRAQQIQSQFQQAQSRLEAVSRQEASLRSQIQRLQSDRQTLIDQANEQIAQRDREITARDRAIAERQSQLESLRQEQTVLEQEVARLQQEFEGLRSGRVTLFRNELLALTALRVENPNAAPEAVNELLRSANRAALERVFPDGSNRNQQVIQITPAEVEQLTNQIQDGRDYVLQIRSNGNYVQGEPCLLAGQPCIKVYATADLNQLVFRQDQVITSASINPPLLQDTDLVEQVNLLLSAVVFRARQARIPIETLTLAGNDPEIVRSFLRQVRTLQQPVDIQVIAASDIDTVGPLEIELRAVQNGQELFNTGNPDSIDPSPEPQ